ncbi:MAG TPA: hypothetical protein VGN12_20835 [Pirellulales bacterium]|jgi:hypothetical protein
MPDVDEREPPGDVPASKPSAWAMWRLRTDPAPLFLFVVPLVLYRVWEYRLPSVAMVRFNYADDVCAGLALLVVIAITRGLQSALRAFVELGRGIAPGTYQSRRRLWAPLLVLGAVAYGLVWAEILMHAGFWFSRAAMERLADSALAHPRAARIGGNCWAGLYYVYDVEIIGQTVVLYLDEDQSTYGFARVPGFTRDPVFNIPHLPTTEPGLYRDFPARAGFQDREGERIMHDWLVVYSSYWRVKLGWS